MYTTDEEEERKEERKKRKTCEIEILRNINLFLLSFGYFWFSATQYFSF